MSGRDEMSRRERITLTDQERRLTRAELSDVLIGDGKRLILRSPDGHFWQLDVDNAGVLATTDLGTTTP
jgi:hypothetical protein